jgi:serine/threonine-protein kinase RsbW
MAVNSRSAALSASLALAPSRDQVGVALDWLENVCAQWQVPQRVAFRLGLCLDEALMNVVMHGSTSAPVLLECQALELGAEIRMVDEGLAFDPTRYQPHPLGDDLETATLGGRGILLMQEMLDGLVYNRQDGKNVLLMSAVLRTTETHDPSPTEHKS